jgi:hypothetical protein
VLLVGYLLDKGILSLTEFQSAMKVLESQVDSRVVDVEKRQTTVESDFAKVIANATTDSEVILARDSTIYGPFGTLDQRLENVEQALAVLAPVGYTVTINHGLGRNPTVVVHYYEYALGTEPAGLGTGPAGTFGGTPAKTVPATVSYPDANTVKVDLPAGFKLSGTPVYQPNDGYWYIIDGYRTLRFDLGVKLGVDDPDTSGGSTSNTGGTTDPDNGGDTGGGTDPKDDTPATPTNVIFTQLTDTTGRLDWQAGA